MSKLLSAVAVLALVVTVAQANLLLNADFAQDGNPASFTSAVINNWTAYGTLGNGYYNNDIDSQMSVTMWWDDVGIYQDWACTPGQEYVLEVDARHPSVEPLVGWHAYLKVEWYDEGFVTKLGEQELDYISSVDPTDTWIPLSGTVTALTGSANGRIVLGLNNYDSSSGKAYFDDASVEPTVIPEPTLAALLAVGLGVVRILRKRR